MDRRVPRIRRWTPQQVALLIARANTTEQVPGKDLAEALEEVYKCYQVLEEFEGQPVEMPAAGREA